MMEFVAIQSNSIEDLMRSFNEHLAQEKVKKIIDAVPNPQYQKSAILTTLYFKQEGLNGGKLPFTLGEAFFKAKIPKEFLR